MNVRHFVFALIAATLSLSSSLYATQATCSFETFSAPSGYTLVSVNGIGDDGTVVGQLVNNKTQAYVGFVRSPKGTFTVYSAPLSSETWIYGQNSTGTSAGSYLDTKGHVHGFLLTNGVFTALNYGSSSNTWLFDVNQLGAAVGSYQSGISVKGFLLVNGNYTTIAYPSQQTTHAMATNDSNAVVGYAASGFMNYGFLWQNGKFTDINYPKAKYGTVLTGINNSGAIVGNDIQADKSFGFLYVSNVFKKIVYPGASYAMAGGINNNGIVSGQIYMTATSSVGYTAACK